MLNTPRASRGLVTAPHHLAGQAGLAVLREGGNAIEAMIAACAVTAVVYPHMTGLGGDGFMLVSRAGQPPIAIEACGRVAAAVDLDFFKARGVAAIPSRGPLAAITVAGTVSGWQAALEVSARCGGRMPLGRLLDDAIFYARNGFAVTGTQARNTAAKQVELSGVPGFEMLYLAAGKAPSEGSRFKNPALAETLSRLAEAGVDDFYRGALARRIAADLARAGSPIGLADLAGQRAREVPALTVRLRNSTLYNFPPPTQGAASLAILGLFDRLDVGEADGFAHVHGAVEATKHGFLLRDTGITDPDHMVADPRDWLSESSLAEMAARIDRDRAGPWTLNPAPGDTVWMGAADANGMVVSYIHSIYWEFGSAVTLRDTGIVWQNRGMSFSLTPGSLHQLIPGRRPFHTNNPALAIFDDGRVMAYGAMGGDGQPQSQAALFTRYGLLGRSLQQAVTAPRWVLGRTWGAGHSGLRLEDRFDARTIEALRAAGHDVEVLEPFTDVMGHAGAAVWHPDGMIDGATDPRSDGVVATF